MLRTTALVSLAVIAPAIALAQPKPAKVAPKCVPAEVTTRWVVAGGVATACFLEDEAKPEKCWAFTPTKAPLPVAIPAKPAPTKADAEVREDAGALSACVGTKCKKLGKKTVAAIAKAKAEGKESGLDATPALTGDGKVVVVGTEAWNVAADKSLKLKQPREYKKGPDTPSLASINIAGGVMIASWSDCAGPCTRSVLVDSNGVNRGAWFGAGYDIALDGKRLAVVPAEVDTTLVVIDIASGKQLAKLELGSDGVIPSMSATRFDDTTVAAVWQTDDQMNFRFISVPVGKPATLGPSYQMAACKP